MLLSKGKLTRDMVSMLDTWKHSGFTVFCGNRIYPHEDTAMENLARYIIRASFSQERMTYMREESKVIYKAKKGGETKTFDALEWLAAMCSHVPDRSEQNITSSISPCGTSCRLSSARHLQTAKSPPHALRRHCC